jgi:hypothetical protein
MKKIVLNVDELRVETFDTAKMEPERGTVRAQSDTDYIRICTNTYDCNNSHCTCYIDAC